MVDWSDLMSCGLVVGNLFLISIVICGLVLLGARLINHLTAKNTRVAMLLTAGFQAGLPLGFTGIAAGYLTGQSRVDEVQAIVPAMLTFVGLIVTYIISQNRLRSLLGGFVVMIFSLDLLIGVFLGSAWRGHVDSSYSSIEALEKKADQEFAIRQYRNALNLPVDEPAKAAPKADASH